MRVSVSNVKVPWSSFLYLWKVEAAGHPSSARCSLTVSDQAAAMRKNVRSAGPDSRRRTAGSGRSAGAIPGSDCGGGFLTTLVSIYGYDTPYLKMARFKPVWHRIS